MTQKTFLRWRSQSSPKGARVPLLAAAINCSSLHARRSLTAAASLCAEKNVLITTLNLFRTGAVNCWLPQPFSLSIHSRTYSGQFSSFIPRASQSLKNFTASRSANLTSRRVVHERDTCSKFFCRVSLIARNAIPRDLDFPQPSCTLACQPDLSFRHDESATGLPRRKRIHDPKILNCKSLNQGGMQIGRST